MLPEQLCYCWRLQDVTIEMLDYDFLNKCTDHGLIRAIVLKLKSGEEGHYPQLVKVCTMTISSLVWHDQHA